MKRIFFPLILGMFFSVLTACEYAEPTLEPPTPEPEATTMPTAAPTPFSMDSLIAAAKKEGTIVSYGLPDDWVNYGGLWKIMKDKYGITHKDTDMTSAEILAALEADKNAPKADMTDLGYLYAHTVMDNDLAQPYENSYWSEIPDYAKDRDGRWAAVYWGAIAFTVNRDKIKNVPQKWTDLLKPEYKNTICMNDPRSSPTAKMVVLAAAIARGGDEKNVKPGLDFFKQLRTNGAIRSIPPSISNVQKGECPILFSMDFDGLSKKRDLKMNLEVVIPQDGSVAGLYITFIPKGAPHSNAAKLMTEVEFSDEGQIAFANGYVHPIRTSVKIPDNLKKDFLPDDAYQVVRFPQDIFMLDTAAQVIADGWGQVLQ